MSWLVDHRSGAADELHSLEPPESRRRVMVMSPTGAAVALGSTQSASVLDEAAVAAAGRTVTRRHSGGGLVVLDPGDALWVDVVIPVDDPHWSTDVGEAFGWLGRVWADALFEVGTTGGGAAVVHAGPARHADLGRVVCFAGLGIGEVSIGDRKVVGMSQRRTRQWSRFQCLVHGRFDPSESLALLAPGLRESAVGCRLGERLDRCVGVVERLDDLLDAFLAALADR